MEIHAAFGYFSEHYLPIDVKPDRYLLAQTEFLISVIEEVCSIWDEDRVGIQVSPEATLLGVDESNLSDSFYLLLDALNFYDVAYVHIIESTKSNRVSHQFLSIMFSLFRSIYHGKIIFGCKDDLDQAKVAIANSNADLISFTK